jgi:inosine/xanthosine triphosphatase
MNDSNIIRVGVGSTNTVKIEAVNRGFSHYFSNRKVMGVKVDSGVSSQPFGHETYIGAENRATNTLRSSEFHFAVGIEGGIIKHKETTFAFAVVVIKDSSGKTSSATTGMFPLPKEVVELLSEGYELGDAVDRVFKQKNSKHGLGAVGLFTKGVVDRTTLYEQGVIYALIPHVNPEYCW